jgi:hypothetical protein
MPATLRSYELLPDREEFVAPHPLRVTILALTPACVLAALGATGAASASVATATGGVLLGLAGIRGGYAWFDARRCRVLADRLLRAHPRSTVPSPLADWRAAQLTSERARRRLVRGVQSLIREADGGGSLDVRVAGACRRTARRLGRGAGRPGRFVMSFQGSGQILVFAAVLIARALRGIDFLALLVYVIVLRAGLMALPARTLGPIVEGLAT